MFKVNDKVVFKGSGVCNIQRIETKSIDDKENQFYVLRVLFDDMMIISPINSDLIRPLIKLADMPKIYKILKTASKADNTTWNRRYREYTEKLKTGDAYEIAFIVRCLTDLRSKKDLSFGERKMLDQAKNLLAQEIASVKEISEFATEQLINTHLDTKTALHLV